MLNHIGENSVWIGFEPTNLAASRVANASVRRNCTERIQIHQLILEDLIARKLYSRPFSRLGGGYYDQISQAPMGTQFAISRFLVPLLAGVGWALYMDSDMMIRQDLPTLFASLDPRKALYCVQCPEIRNTEDKSDGLTQTVYFRKNWSSFMVFNCKHPAMSRLTLEKINSLPGRDLHAFSWLDDSEIGFLDQSWNYLVGISEPMHQPANVHWTLGTPNKVTKQPDFADEFWRLLRECEAGEERNEQFTST